MKNGQIVVYYGEGRGKTSVAIGRGIRALGEELRVVMIQFLEYRNNKETDLLKHFEPEFRLFRFEKEREFDTVDDAAKEVAIELKNALYFANKIMDTGECEVFLLDGILECVNKGYLTMDALAELLKKRPLSMNVILTGDSLTEGLLEIADAVYEIRVEK
ncbi:cob(I)yrinic acid a,c-diamide adenosyltransferase [Chakrabartyella piscis]|uniref:cob(I)yrinic acid a,c-diamide adenosyltransferase n=1 Tax=Chakrabartyella piscis TaxID=2918914 RepID=UPI00295837B9|nr:cob(I)yrinic acid a,c-diamide adenosyltransferase [Chakrabartyella piscis]